MKDARKSFKIFVNIYFFQRGIFKINQLININ